MMGIRIDINGHEIVNLGVWNSEETNDDGETRYEVFDLSDAGLPTDVREAPHVCDVWHHREDGADTLTALVMEEVPDDLVGSED